MLPYLPKVDANVRRRREVTPFFVRLCEEGVAPCTKVAPPTCASVPYLTKLSCRKKLTPNTLFSSAPMRVPALSLFYAVTHIPASLLTRGKELGPNS